MRMVNFRLLAILLVGTALAAGGVHLVNHFQLRRHAGFFLDKARQEKNEGKYKEAIGFFDSYLALEPGDADATAEYGFLLADVSQNRSPGAYGMFEKVLRSNPERSGVRRRLLDVAMRLGRYGDAQEHLRLLLGESPDDVTLLWLAGTCAAATGQYQNAVDAYQSVVKQAPDRFDAYRAMAELFHKHLDRPEDADARMNTWNHGGPRHFWARIAGPISAAALANAIAMPPAPPFISP
jgi:tetratricopeptide (TPR) repeat protein